MRNFRVTYANFGVTDIDDMNFYKIVVNLNLDLF
jgi:hypothetical protein